MILTINITSQIHQDVAKICSADQSDISIGRGKNNQLVLPDTRRIISYQHALIQYRDGQYILEDRSTNGTFVNDATEPVGNGNRVVLHAGDRITIGDYEMLCSMDSQQTQVIPDKTDLWQAETLGSGETGILYENEQQIPYPDEIEDDEDIPADFDFLKPENENSSPQHYDSTPAEQQPFIPPRAAIPNDWLPEAEDKPSRKKAPPPPSKSTPARKTLKPKESISNSSDNTALNAFFTGLGIPIPQVDQAEQTELMESAGRILREMTQGFKYILDNRTVIKNELRLGVTMIQSTENNPLKFSVDTNDALNKLLMPAQKGYLAPLPAVKEAIVDLQAHEMAIIVGLRAALGTLVSRFDPKQLEKSFQDGSILDNLLPVAKKAKFWELFKDIYETAAADAENDFLKLLGEEFADAYIEHIAELKRNKRSEVSQIN